jgi:hypothetical protein
MRAMCCRRHGLGCAQFSLHSSIELFRDEAVAKTKAVLVDIRPASQRALEGAIDGALVVERNVLVASRRRAQRTRCFKICWRRKFREAWTIELGIIELRKT